jgi:capsular polysaccharide biosynthesis protein
MNEEITLEHLLNGLKKMFSMFFKKWKLILTFTVIGSILGVIYAFYTKPLYIAEMTMLVKENKPTTFNGLVASELGLNVINNENSEIFSKNNIKEFIKSRNIIQKTLSKKVNSTNLKTTLGELYYDIYLSENKKSHFNQSKLSITNNEPRDERFQDSVFGIVYENVIHNCLKINQNQNNLQIIKIQMSSTDERFSEAFLNNLELTITEECLERKTKNFKVLEIEIDSIRNEINTLVGCKNNAVSSLKNNLNKNEINERILYELLNKLELAKLSVKINPSLVEILDKPILPLPIKKVSYAYASSIGGLIGGFSIILIVLIKMILKRKFN